MFKFFDYLTNTKRVKTLFDYYLNSIWEYCSSMLSFCSFMYYRVTFLELYPWTNIFTFIVFILRKRLLISAELSVRIMNVGVKWWSSVSMSQLQSFTWGEMGKVLILSSYANLQACIVICFTEQILPIFFQERSALLSSIKTFIPSLDSSVSIATLLAAREDESRIRPVKAGPSTAVHKVPFTYVL